MTNNQTEEKPIVVFVSYSWDSEDHKQWVLNLADKLTTEGGVFVILDRYDLRAGKTMTHFMEKAVNQADKVLLIMTPNYQDKADNRLGGVGYEYSMVTQEFYENLENDKFIPIRRSGTFEESAPKFLKSYLSHDMTKDTSFENDFNDLLRVIYNEPEIKRPPLGKKPSFTSTNLSSSPSTLIDNATNLSKTGMNTYAKWEIDLKLPSLDDQTKSELFRLLNGNILVDKENKHSLPFILSNNYKVSHHPEVLYEIPIHRYIAYNHLIHEKLKVEEGLIHYEFAEYSNHDFWLLFTSQPFSTLFYLLVILRSIHQQLGREIEVSLQIGFNSDRKSMLYSKYSPFSYPHIYNMQKMVIDNKANLSISLKEITKDSVFRCFQQLYSLFVSDNPKSTHPFVELDRQHFDMLADEFIK